MNLRILDVSFRLHFKAITWHVEIFPAERLIYLIYRPMTKNLAQNI